jgi:hypothetical protein
MQNMILPVVLFLALSIPALAQNKGQNNNNQGQNNNNQGGVRGAPSPIVGAGLPILLIGGGIYLLVRRTNRTS